MSDFSDEPRIESLHNLAMLTKIEKEIDIERAYTPRQTADKLRRIADAIDAGQSFRIQVGGNRLRVPTDGEFEVEMQADGEGQGEIEIEIKWNRKEQN